jgi:hypothetical protein
VAKSLRSLARATATSSAPGEGEAGERSIRGAREKPVRFSCVVGFVLEFGQGLEFAQGYDAAVFGENPDTCGSCVG